MKWLWGVSVGLCMCGWLFLVGVFVPADWLVGIALIAGGLVALIGGMVRVYPWDVSRWWVLVGIIGVVGLFVVPFPFSLGCVFLLGGVGCLCVKWFFPEQYIVGLFGMSWVVFGFVLLVQALMVGVYVWVVSFGHRIDVFASVVSGLLRVGGVDAAVGDGLLFVQTSEGVISMVMTWEKLGLLPWLLLSGGLIFLMVVGYEWKVWRGMLLWFLVGSGLFLLGRVLVVVMVFVSFGLLEVFYDPMWVMVSFVPLIGFVGWEWWRYRESGVYNPFKRLRVNRRLVVAGVLLVVGVSAGVGAVGFVDPGMEKAGVVLVDEVHSSWEDSVRPVDTEWFGLLSTYNYFSWVEWMNQSYEVRRHVVGDLTEVVLAEVDVLVLKCPTMRYLDEEIGVISRFVADGGGVWLIGDHTDVFGMNTFLNQVASVFGIEFRNDATYELGSGNLTSVKQAEVWPHPCMMGVDELEFMTSCSLGRGLFSDVVVLGSRMNAEPGTYATENFFRDSVISAESEFGVFVQMVGVEYGRGRVVAFSDSTVFSSFSVFTDGYQGLSLGTLQYLNRMNTGFPFEMVLWVVALVCVIGGVVVMRCFSRYELLLMVGVAGMLAVGIMVPVVSFVNESFYGVSDDGFGADVFFDVGHSKSTVDVRPRVSFFEEADNFGTLFVWSQRVGLIPRVVDSWDSSVLSADVLMVVNPCESFTVDELNVVDQFIDRGGCLVVFDSIENPRSTANELVGGFGLFRYISDDTLELFENQSEINSSVGVVSVPVLEISGGSVVGETNGSVMIRGVEQVNESSGRVGRVLLVVDAYSFSNKVLGGPLSDPTEMQRRLYETVFYIYEVAMADELVLS